jgi:hypothetical protein
MFSHRFQTIIIDVAVVMVGSLLALPFVLMMVAPFLGGI